MEICKTKSMFTHKLTVVSYLDPEGSLKLFESWTVVLRFRRMDRRLFCGQSDVNGKVHFHHHLKFNYIFLHYSIYNALLYSCSRYW